MQFSIFDPTDCQFPRPHVPVLSAFPSGVPGLCSKAFYRSAFLETPGASYSLGRYALAAALRSLGVGPGTTVLIPAYHCRTMIDPVVRLGGNVQLFPLLPDLIPDSPLYMSFFHFNGYSNCLSLLESFSLLIFTFASNKTKTITLIPNLIIIPTATKFIFVLSVYHTQDNISMNFAKFGSELIVFHQPVLTKYIGTIFSSYGVTL